MLLIKNTIAKANAIPFTKRKKRNKTIKQSAEDRLEKYKASFISKTILVVTGKYKGCIVWTGYADPNGYGRVSYKGKSCYAHVVAFILTRGVEPENWVLHHCDKPNCVRGDHIYDGTPKDNARDRDERTYNRRPNK